MSVFPFEAFSPEGDARMHTNKTGTRSLSPFFTFCLVIFDTGGRLNIVRSFGCNRTHNRKEV